jgi:TIGR03009 family protein
MQRFLLVLFVFGWLGSSADAQNRPVSWQDSPNALRSGGTGRSVMPLKPDQPVIPQSPTFQHRPAPPNPSGQAIPPAPPPRAPFQLAPGEESQLNQVLAAWEKESQKISTFDCKFKRWEYYPALAAPGQNPDKAAYIDLGIIKYAKPDKGKFQTLYTEQPDGKTTKEVPVEENRAELYICDGKSVYKYDPAHKLLHEFQLPPELQGKAIVDSPLPFIFGAEAKKLRERYFLRIVTPPEVRNQIWIEAYPRYQEEAANFDHTLLILELPKLTPLALQIVYPGGKDKASYQFFDVTINDLLRVFKSNPFQAYTPRGWQIEIHPPQSANIPKPPGLR